MVRTLEITQEKIREIRNQLQKLDIDKTLKLELLKKEGELEEQLLQHHQKNYYQGRLCWHCGQPLPKDARPHRKYHHQDENQECYYDRMRPIWQDASNKHRLKKKKQQNYEIRERTFQIKKGQPERSHDGTGGRLGTSGLGGKMQTDPDREAKVVEKEMRRYGLKIG